jgi:hypothetical protein
MPTKTQTMMINSFKGYLSLLGAPPRAIGLRKIIMIRHVFATRGLNINVKAMGVSQKRRWQITFEGLPIHMSDETKPKVSPTSVTINMLHVAGRMAAEFR